MERSSVNVTLGDLDNRTSRRHQRQDFARRLSDVKLSLETVTRNLGVPTDGGT